MEFYTSAGNRFRKALQQEKPLQIAGTINAYTALLAERASFKAIYLSGSGVASASYGMPDLGITNLRDVLDDVYRITNVSTLPLIVDIDTGWGNALNIARTIKSMSKAGAAGVHIEDQEQAKRCGHRPGKVIVSTAEMCDRLKAAVDARIDPSFVIMARTDALANEGLERAIERACKYVEAGAEIIFFEGVKELSEYKALSEVCNVPVLANITEFGLTPLWTRDELAKAGVSLILYPLSAFRAMNAAALKVYQTIREQGSQEPMLKQMQTREELYDILDYHIYEKNLDKLLAEGK